MKKIVLLLFAATVAVVLNAQDEEENVRKAPKHKIGEHFGGGVVFFVYSDGEHGLIASLQDQDKGLRWFGGCTLVTKDGLGAGKKNTEQIIAYKGTPPDATFAAKLCDNYSVVVDGVKYDDWFLPSKLELSLLYMRRQYVGGFSYNYYWSSTIHKGDQTWFQDFGNGRQEVNISMPNSVRAVRAF